MLRCLWVVFVNYSWYVWYRTSTAANIFFGTGKAANVFGTAPNVFFDITLSQKGKALSQKSKALSPHPKEEVPDQDMSKLNWHGKVRKKAMGNKARPHVKDLSKVGESKNISSRDQDNQDQNGSIGISQIHEVRVDSHEEREADLKEDPTSNLEDDHAKVQSILNRRSGDSSLDKLAKDHGNVGEEGSKDQNKPTLLLGIGIMPNGKKLGSEVLVNQENGEGSTHSSVDEVIVRVLVLGVSGVRSVDGVFSQNQGLVFRQRLIFWQ